MRLVRLLLVLVLALVVTQCKKRQPESDTSGFMGGTKHVDQAFILYAGKQASQEKVTQYIKSVADGEDPDFSHEQIAKMIVEVSSCFQIDSCVMTGLIHQESGDFDPKVRGENGYGLTQMTGAAIDEVNDQLGKRGTGNATAQAIKYFNSVLDGCVAPKFGMASWEPLWTAAAKQKTSMKMYFVINPLYGVTYGAALLKVYLSHRHVQSGAGNLADQSYVKRVYSGALNDYNSVFDSYASSVLRYAAEVSKLELHVEKKQDQTGNQ